MFSYEYGVKERRRELAGAIGGRTCFDLHTLIIFSTEYLEGRGVTSSSILHRHSKTTRSLSKIGGSLPRQYTHLKVDTVILEGSIAGEKLQGGK